MCGFVALIGRPFEAKRITPMLECIRSRGPDKTSIIHGTWFSLGFHRLAIVSPDAGNQPLSSSSASVHLAFNGEIYNYRELQQRLSTSANPDVESEAEVLLALYEKQGPSFVQALDGDYAIIVLDSRTKTCHLFRDPFGVKPLYYAPLDRGHTWAIASHIRPFFQDTSFSTEPDYVALRERQVLSFWSSNRTFFGAVRQLTPGSSLRINVGSSDVATIAVSERSKNVQPVPKPQQQHSASAIDHCYKAIHQAIRKRITHTDVAPVVLALSGGIDSSLMSALAASDLRQYITAVTIYDDEGSQDYKYAGWLARCLKVAHHTDRLTLADFLAHYPRIIAECPGPTPGFSPYFIGRAVRRFEPIAKVMLCGEGADEIFLGYPLYVRTAQYLNQVRVRLDSTPAHEVEQSPLLRRVANWRRMEDQELLRDLIALFQGDQLVNAHLVPFDHGPMAHAVECRVPFLDREVLESAQAIPLNSKLLNQIPKIVLRVLLGETLTQHPALSVGLLSRPTSAAFDATRRCRTWLNGFIGHSITRGRSGPSELAPYARSYEDLFWLDSVMAVYYRYRANVDEMTFEDLSSEVLRMSSTS